MRNGEPEYENSFAAVGVTHIKTKRTSRMVDFQKLVFAVVFSSIILATLFVTFGLIQKQPTVTCFLRKHWVDQTVNPSTEKQRNQVQKNFPEQRGEETCGSASIGCLVTMLLWTVVAPCQSRVGAFANGTVIGFICP